MTSRSFRRYLPWDHSRLAQQLEDPMRRHRYLGDHDAEGREGVRRGIRDRGRRADRAALADPLLAEFAIGRRGLHVLDADIRHLGRARQQIIGERRGERLAILIERHLLIERRADALRRAAIDLTVDDHRVDQHAAVLDDDVVEDLDRAELGIGGALLEEIQYGPDGQPANPNFMDYLLPAIGNIPEIRLEHMETPTPNNPDGMKGAGEGGAIGPPAAIANAVSDALAPFGIVVTEVPVTPQRVFRLLGEAGVVGKEVLAETP